MEITKETTMGEMLEYDRGIAYILMQSSNAVWYALRWMPLLDWRVIRAGL